MDFMAKPAAVFLALCLSGCATDQAIEEISKEFVMPEDIEAVVFQAKKAEIQGRYIEAIEQYKAALEKNEHDLAAQVGLGGVYLRQGVLTEAEVLLIAVTTSDVCQALNQAKSTETVTSGAKKNELTQALNQRETDKKNAEYCGVAWNGLGVIHDMGSDFVGAEKHYAKAIEYRPDDAAFYNNYGYSLMMAHNYEKAENILRQGYSLAPNSKRIRNNLAFSMAWMGKYDQALETFSETLDDPEAFNNIGYIALLSHDYSRAINLFEKAIELSPAYYVKASHNLKKAQRLKQEEDLRRKLLQGAGPVEPSELPATSAMGEDQPKVVSLSETDPEVSEAPIPAAEPQAIESTP